MSITNMDFSKEKLAFFRKKCRFGLIYEDDLSKNTVFSQKTFICSVYKPEIICYDVLLYSAFVPSIITKQMI